MVGKRKLAAAKRKLAASCRASEISLQSLALKSPSSSKHYTPCFSPTRDAKRTSDKAPRINGPIEM